MKKLGIIVIILSFGFVMSIHADDKKPNEEERDSKIDVRDYKIGPSDTLNIVTWEEERFSIEGLVRIDGKITFPLLNDIQAAGLTPMELKAEIEKKLKVYVENPIVTVTVVNPNSKKFYVLGEVARTNEYPLLKETTVLQAFAIAGGFTEWASKKEILLIRRENGKDNILEINYKDIIKGKNPENNILLKENDTIVVP